MTSDPTLATSTRSYDRDPRFVYFIQAISGGPIKIGVGRDPASRLLALQPGNPEQLRIIGVIRGGGFVRERDLHVRFRASRMYGEWFKPTPELLAVIEKESVSFDSVSTEEIKLVYRRAQGEHERATLGLDVNGPRLRELRKNRRKSVSALAAQAGISHQFLGFIEHGKRRPLPPVFDRICDALGLEGDEDRKKLIVTAAQEVA